VLRKQGYLRLFSLIFSQNVEIVKMAAIFGGDFPFSSNKFCEKATKFHQVSSSAIGAYWM
jgi:hypothetical protein